jgi:trimethylamine-N-oxide reductase (cytochrome c)
MTFDEFWNMPAYFADPWDPLGVGGYFIPPGFDWYANLPEGAGLDTKSGKLEFFAQWIDEWFPNDPERPPVPHYIPSWEGLSTPLAEKYPLLVDSPHPRYRFHTQYNEVPWLNEIPGYKMRGPDGYFYEVLWIHPKDAAARGIKEGDIVRTFNDRGQVLHAAYVTERMMPGHVRAPDGGFYDPEQADSENPQALVKGGAMNTLTPIRFHSKHASSFTVSAYLVEVEKWEGPIPQSESERRITEGG